MLYKRFVYTPVILIITVLKLAAPKEGPHSRVGITHENAFESFGADGTWNGSASNAHRDAFPEEEVLGRSNPVQSFHSEVNKCIEDHQYLITENFNQGKSVILKCFKTTLMLNMLRHLGESSERSIKLFNGLLEFKKIPEEICSGGKCDERRNRNYGAFQNKKNEYARLYKKAMQRLINERKRLKSYRNQTAEEKADQLNRINANSQAFLSEVIKNIGNEDVEKAEEEKLKKEVTDPKLLSVLDALTKKYMLKFRFYPGVAARMMRSSRGGFTFDLELQDSETETETEEVEEEEEEEVEEEEEEEVKVSSDESITREMKDGPQAKDYIDYDDGNNNNRIRYGNRKKAKNDKKKKKEIKKKAKKLKKILPYLLLPMIIQVTLLPFVLKKLFFLAMKALFAGKVALILVAFNLLRNTCIKNDDDFQKIRVEHYGYGRGEEYGAWINGRSLPGPPWMSALSHEPYRGHEPVSQ